MKKAIFIFTCILFISFATYGRKCFPDIYIDDMIFEDVAAADNDVEPFFVLNDYIGNNEKVVIPDSVAYQGVNYAVKGISQLAFLKSRGFLKEVYLPNSVTYINEDVFYECKNLRYVKLPERLTSIGAHAFNGCVLITDVVFPKSLTHLGQSAFFGCRNLKNIVFTSSNIQLWANEEWMFPFALCHNDLTITAPQAIINRASNINFWKDCKWEEYKSADYKTKTSQEKSEKPKESDDSEFDWLFYYYYFMLF